MVSPPGGMRAIQAECGPSGHRYNDDLLVQEKVRCRAMREHPRVFHALDHPVLRREFTSADITANGLKRRSEVVGVWALIGALVALSGGASESLWGFAPEPWPKLVAAAAGTIGIAALAVAGLGLVYGRQKQEWLRLRLKTERLRQFHFQTFVLRLREVLDSMRSDGAREAFERKREEWFCAFMDDLEKEQLGSVSTVTDPSKVPVVWVHGSGIDVPRWPEGAGDADVADIFAAYDALRFSEQEAYADYMLRENNRPPAGVPPGSPAGPMRRRPWYPGIDRPPKVKQRFLLIVVWSALVTLVSLHGAVVLGSLMGLEKLRMPWVHVGVVICALVAVAARTLSEGLALTRDIERCEEYYAVVSDLRRRFRASSDIQEKFRLMVEMEQAAYQEMRSFLRGHEKATFVM